MTFLHFSFWLYFFSIVLCQSDDKNSEKDADTLKNENEEWIKNLPEAQRWIGYKLNGDWHSWAVKKETALKSLILGYSFVVLRGRIEAEEARYAKGTTMKTKDLAKYLKINQAKLNVVGGKIVQLVEDFLSTNPGEEVVTLKIDDFFNILATGVIMQDTIATKASYHYFMWKYIFEISTHPDIKKLKQNKTPEELDDLCTDMSFLFILSCGPIHVPPVPLLTIGKADILSGLKLSNVKVSADINTLIDFLFSG